jgi:hypothetical protein
MDCSFFAVRDRTSGAATKPSAKFIACLLSILSACAMAKPMFAQTSAPKRIVIAASAVLDGEDMWRYRALLAPISEKPVSGP